MFKMGAMFATVSTQQKRSFCINKWQWMKHGSITSLWSQIGSQLSEQQQVKAVSKRPKTQISAGKVLPSVFWDAQGILFIDYFGKGRTINSEYYIALLVHLKEEITKNGHKWRRKKSSFTKTIQCHKSIAMMAKLNELHFELLLHPPYSPNLIPSNYWLFAELKRML